MSEHTDSFDLPPIADAEVVADMNNWLDSVWLLGSAVVSKDEAGLCEDDYITFDDRVEELNDHISRLPGVAVTYSGTGFFPQRYLFGYSQFYGDIPESTGRITSVYVSETDDIAHVPWGTYSKIDALLRAEHEQEDSPSQVIASEDTELRDRVRTVPDGLRLFVVVDFERLFETDVPIVDTVRSDRLRLQHHVEATSLKVSFISTEDYVEPENMLDPANIPDALEIANHDYTELLEDDGFFDLSLDKQTNKIEALLANLNNDLCLGVLQSSVNSKYVLIPPGPDQPNFVPMYIADEDTDEFVLSTLRVDSMELATSHASNSPIKKFDGHGLCLVGTLEVASESVDYPVVWVPLEQDDLRVKFMQPAYDTELTLY